MFFLKNKNQNQNKKDQIVEIEEKLGREAENNLKAVKEMCKSFGDSMGSMNLLGVLQHFKKLNTKKNSISLSW